MQNLKFHFLLFPLMFSIISSCALGADSNILNPEDYYPVSSITSPQFGELFSYDTNQILLQGNARTGTLASKDTVIQSVNIQIGTEGNIIPTSIVSGAGTGELSWEKEMVVSPGMWRVYSICVDSQSREELEPQASVFHVGYAQSTTPAEAAAASGAVDIDFSDYRYGVLESTQDKFWYFYTIPDSPEKATFFTTNRLLNGASMPVASLILSYYENSNDIYTSSPAEVISNSGVDWPEMTIELSNATPGNIIYFSVEYYEQSGQYVFGIK